MKQTAVEWFAKELNNWRIKEFGEDSIIGIPEEVFEQAKQREKEQMIQIYKAAFTDGFNGELFEFEQYYNETFKSE